MTARRLGSFSSLALLAIGFSSTAVSADRSDFRHPHEIPFPADNPYTPEKLELGKALFFDPRLSAAENMNCSSCHNPSFGWEVPVKTAVGSQNMRLERRVPTILNVAWVAPLFWDGRAPSVEQQAKSPIENPFEMNLPLTVAVERLSAIDGYKQWFALVFPNEGVTPDTIVKAIATFERTIVALDAPFDRWVDGDESAISDSQKRGFELFVGKAHCASCHSGWNFTDNKFHDTGTPGADLGRGKIEPDNPMAQFAFKTSTLRSVAHRAPYMHNGELATLHDVVVQYTAGGIDRPSRDPLIQPLDLSDRDISDLVDFLKSLSDAARVVPLPMLPN